MTTLDFQRGFTDAYKDWGPVQEDDPDFDLRWILVGQPRDFIRGFSLGLAEYKRDKQSRSEHDLGEEP